MKKSPVNVHAPLLKVLDAIDLQSLIMCAYSGGLDSTVLLHLLSIHCPSLLAVYINHGIRDAAEQKAEIQHVEQQCTKLGVSLARYNVNVQSDTGNIEDNARRLRYECLEHAALEHGTKVLFLAHHQDDQLETLLLQLFRSGSLSAMAGMQAKRPISSKHPDIILYRPFLDIPRASLEAYAKEEKVSWIEDSTNANTRYSRNYIRKELIPRIIERFPASRTSITRAAHDAQELIATTNRSLSELISPNKEGMRINRKIFARLNTFEKVQVLRKALSMLFARPITAIRAITVVPDNGKERTSFDIFHTQGMSNAHFKERFSSFSTAFFTPILNIGYNAEEYTNGTGAKDRIGDTIILKGHGVYFLLQPEYIVCKHLEQIDVSGYFFFVSSKKIQLSVQCTGNHACLSTMSYALSYTAMQGNTVIIRSPMTGDHIITQQEERSVSGIVENVPAVYRGLVPVVEDSHGVVAVLASLFGGRTYSRSEDTTEVLRIQTKCVSIP